MFNSLDRDNIAAVRADVEITRKNVDRIIINIKKLNKLLAKLNRKFDVISGVGSDPNVKNVDQAKVLKDYQDQMDGLVGSLVDGVPSKPSGLTGIDSAK